MNRAVVYGMAVGVGAVGVGMGLYLLGRRLLRRSKHSHGHGHSHGHNDHDHDWDKEMINCMIGSHYAPPEEYMPYPFGPKESLDFPKRCAEFCVKHKAKGAISRAMDIGCGPGGVTFELARGFSEVVGLDISQPFIARCQELKMTGQTSYWMATEGDLGETKTATVDPTIDRSRVQFILGDVCNLPPGLGQFGCVLVLNFICGMTEPMKLFRVLPELVVPGGILVIMDHYACCSKEKVLPEELKKLKGFDMFQRVLGPHFELVEEQDMPIVDRETARVYYWMIDHATVWRRRQET